MSRKNDLTEPYIVARRPRPSPLDDAVDWTDALRRLEAGAADPATWEERASDILDCPASRAIDVRSLTRSEHHARLAVSAELPKLYDMGNEFAAAVISHDWTDARKIVRKMNRAIRAYGGPDACRRKLLMQLPRMEVIAGCDKARSYLWSECKDDDTRARAYERIDRIHSRAVMEMPKIKTMYGRKDAARRLLNALRKVRADAAAERRAKTTTTHQGPRNAAPLLSFKLNCQDQGTGEVIANE